MYGCNELRQKVAYGALKDRSCRPIQKKYPNR